MVYTGVIAVFLLGCVAIVSSEAKDGATLAGVSVNKRDNRGYDPFYHDCLVHGHRFRDGQIFNIPNLSRCLEYRCSRGSWDIYREACDVDGRCRPVGSYFEHNDCRTYRCERQDRGDHFYYIPTVVRTRCKDAQGRCRNQWETFPGVINRRQYPFCQCIVSNQGHVRYSCRSH